jgi:SAM-dependent methyltransferase
VTGSLEQMYDAFPLIEEEFGQALDESLSPRGPELLYELVAQMGLPPGSVVADVGCGDGRHAIRLGAEHRFDVVAIDPVPQFEGARVGTAEALPLESGSVDLVWCRDALSHVADLDAAYAELARVLRPGGRALVYQSVGTDRLEPGEAEWLRHAIGMEHARLQDVERAIAAAGLRVDESIDLAGEWGERLQETSGEPGRRLLHASRLLRDPDRYVARFGRENYEIMLADCLWHVYRMIGKLDYRIFVLTKP